MLPLSSDPTMGNSPMPLKKKHRHTNMNTNEGSFYEVKNDLTYLHLTVQLSLMTLIVQLSLDNSTGILSCLHFHKICCTRRGDERRGEGGE